jgi:putative heme iron utilization protein
MYPSFAEAARTLLARESHIVLATITPEGYPYSSTVAYAVTENGDMLMLLSQLAQHTQNMALEDVTTQAQASLFIHDQLGLDDPLAEPRLSLLGKVKLEPDKATYQAAFTAKHPQAEVYVNFTDFSFYRFVPDKLYYIAGFGRMGWATAEDYRAARPDPLSEVAEGAITHMNEDHRDALCDYVRVFGESRVNLEGVTEAKILTLDQFGFDVLATVTADVTQPVRVRIPFTNPVTDPADLRGAMVALSEKAKIGK